jgi:hypothetical protein
MKRMELIKYTQQFPAINELHSYGIEVLTEIGEALCAHCSGQGKDCERPCKPCQFCEGRGKVDVPLFVLGCPAIGGIVPERQLSPLFETLDECEAHAMQNKDKLLREEAARVIPVLSSHTDHAIQQP